FPLAPGNSNISQTLFILLSCGFFLVAAAAFARRVPRFGEAAFVWAAMVNLVLGLLDLLGLDLLLALIRTACYSRNNVHTQAGLPRVIGGFAEASSFGAFSAALFAYFMASVLIGRRPRDGLLALATLACAAVSLSSSGIVSLGAAGLILMLHAGIWL